jgi:hypothetical protein
MNSVLEAADRVRQVSTGELVVLDITRDGHVTVDEMLVYAQSGRYYRVRATWDQALYWQSQFRYSFTFESIVGLPLEIVRDA